MGRFCRLEFEWHLEPSPFSSIDRWSLASTTTFGGLHRYHERSKVHDVIYEMLWLSDIAIKPSAKNSLRASINMHNCCEPINSLGSMVSKKTPCQPASSGILTLPYFQYRPLSSRKVGMPLLPLANHITILSHIAQIKSANQRTKQAAGKNTKSQHSSCSTSGDALLHGYHATFAQ